MAWSKTGNIQGPTGAAGGSIAGINAQTGTTYTLVLTDKNKLVTSSNTSAQTITVPPHSSVAFAADDVVYLSRLNTGSVTVVAGSGVTINKASTLILRARYSFAALINVGTDSWLLVGDTT